MTLEQECYREDQGYIGKQRILSRILRKLREKDLPGAPYGEQYFLATVDNGGTKTALIPMLIMP